MRQKIFWKRADIARLKELVKTKSNKELEEIFSATYSELVTVMKRYRIKRTEEELHKIKSDLKSGENHHNWKGGGPRKRNNQYKHRLTQLKTHPEETKARLAVAYAVKTGKLIKPTCCSKCGEEASVRDIHFHHTESYEKEFWLVGIWLCRRCHRKVHEEKKEND